MSATFKASLKPGRYEVRLAYPPNQNRASSVPVTIEHLGGTTKIRIDQRSKPEIDGLFHVLGSYEFGEHGVVEVSSERAEGHVVIDAVVFRPLGK